MTHKVTDESLEKFRSEIVKAAENLQVATLSLRSLYVVNSSSVESFVKLRQKITNEAKVYSTTVLPTSNDLIRTIRSFFDDYRYVNIYKYNFKDYLNYFTREANDVVDVCKLTLELNKSILVEFKKSEDEVIRVLDQLESETKVYEQKKKELIKSSNVRLKWAIGLALVPVVNVIAGPILYIKSNKDLVSAIAESEEKLLTVAAAEAIKGPLIMSITNLVSAFNYISGLFIALADELTKLGDDKLGDDELIAMHYKIVENKRAVIVEACDTYFSKVPDAETNLQAIPDDYDKNYVEEWRSKRSPI